MLSTGVYINLSVMTTKCYQYNADMTLQNVWKKILYWYAIDPIYTFFSSSVYNNFIKFHLLKKNKLQFFLNGIRIKICAFTFLIGFTNLKTYYTDYGIISMTYGQMNSHVQKPKIYRYYNNNTW